MQQESRPKGGSLHIVFLTGGRRFLGPLWEGAVGEADGGRESADSAPPSVTPKGRNTSLAEGGFRSSAPAGAAGRIPTPV